MNADMHDEFTSIKQSLQELRSDFDAHERHEQSQIQTMSQMLSEHMLCTGKHEAVIDSLVKQQADKAAFWGGVSQSVVASGAWGIIMACIALTWYGFKGQMGIK